MHTVIKQQNNELRTKNNELQQIIEQQNNTIKELERNYKNLQIAKAVSDSGGDTTEAKRKIEEISPYRLVGLTLIVILGPWVRTLAFGRHMGPMGEPRGAMQAHGAHGNHGGHAPVGAYIGPGRPPLEPL